MFNDKQQQNHRKKKKKYDKTINFSLSKVRENAKFFWFILLVRLVYSKSAFQLTGPKMDKHKQTLLSIQPKKK